MYENVAKRLRWLAFNFPHTDKPKSESDKICNCINLYCTEAAYAIEELSREIDIDNAAITAMSAAIPNWISVTERLPDDRRDVQITVFWHDAWQTMYGYYDGAYWHLYAPMHTEVADVYVIGWMEKPAPMPLPEPPKEET